MRLTVIGSADAFNTAGRAHSCYWLDGAADEPFMVDFGGTALQSIGRLGRDPDALAGVVLTHLHGDHFGGLPYLAIDLTFIRQRTRPLTVVGPEGTRERVTGLLELTYPTLLERHARYELVWVETRPGDAVELGGARIHARAAVHLDPPDQALCLRVEGRDGSVVAFSGDTAPCPGLLEVADGADLLVAECTALRPPVGRHCTWEDWQDLLPRVGARRTVFSHLGPGVRGLTATDLGATGVDVTLADDGLVLDVPPRR